MNGVRLFTLLNPTIGLIFAAVFFATWLSQRTRTYILVIALATFCYALATGVQVFMLPRDVGANTMLSTFLYLSSLCLFIHGVLTRARVRTSHLLLGSIAATIFILHFYFFYIDRSLVTRIYVMHVGAGLLLGYAAFGLSRARSRRMVDRLLFWVLLVCALHFLPRTLLSLALDGPLRSETFGVSVFWTVLNFSLIIMALTICLTLLFAIALDVIEDLKSERNTDPMTGLLNRRGFEEEAQTALTKQGGDAISLVYCDIDHFKSINDGFGHAAGDAVIRDFAQLLSEEVRVHDVAGRIGGEEFAVLLGTSDEFGAHLFAERLRKRVAVHRFPGLPAGRGVTASFGIAERRPSEPLAGLMRRADRLLYVAKRGGRNRAQIEEQPLRLA